MRLTHKPISVTEVEAAQDLFEVEKQLLRFSGRRDGETPTGCRGREGARFNWIESHHRTVPTFRADRVTEIWASLRQMAKVEGYALPRALEMIRQLTDALNASTALVRQANESMSTRALAQVRTIRKDVSDN